MVDVGIQSESEEFNDSEMNAYGWNTADRKPSFLQVVPEEEHEDDELEMVCLFSYSTSSADCKIAVFNKWIV
mgnify:FL=1